VVKVPAFANLQTVLVFQQYKMRNTHYVLNEQSSEPLNHCSHYGIEKFSFARIWMDIQSFVVLGKWTAICVNMRDVPPFGGT